MLFRRYYFIVSGVAAHLAILIFVALLFKHYDLTSNQVFHRLLDKLGVNFTFINNTVLANSFDYPIKYNYLPTLTDNPRILLQVKQFISGEISAADLPSQELVKYNPCREQSLLALMACGLVTKNEKALSEAKSRSLNFQVILPSASGHHANAWQLALAYDALKHIVEYSPEEKEIINTKLNLALKHYLILLNNNEASLWHGRTTLSAQMWMTQLALDNINKNVLKNTTDHFYSMVDALSMTEAWPEGYNYWINSRAFYVVLALSAYLNGTEVNHWHNKIFKLLERIGYWHIQATRPDWQIEPLGDEGPRLDLKDESRRVIDIIAQVTKNPIFFKYSSDLAKLHGVESYYSSYRWGWSLFYPAQINNVKPKPLPLMDIFGEQYFGQSYIRENWQSSATFITFRAGNSFTHHGHYDNGHVSLFKGAPLLVNSSVPGKYYSENRLNYSIRTVAKNSVLVQRKNERVVIAYNKENSISDGGQRVTLPLGSAITTIADWFEKNNQAPVLAGGRILLTDKAEDYSYIKADLTKAYNSDWYDDNGHAGKLELVERELLYLREQDVLLIKDTVHTVDRNQVKIVFHTVNKPVVTNEKLLKGQSNNGILSSQSRSIKVQNDMAYLNIEIISDVADVRLIGGEDYKFYVETDGDDNILDGKNFSGGLTPQQIEQAPNWRIEINGKRRPQQTFITVLRPSLHHYREEKTDIKILSTGAKAYLIADLAVIFNKKELIPIIFNKRDRELLSGKKILMCGSKTIKSKVCGYVG